MFAEIIFLLAVGALIILWVIFAPVVTKAHQWHYRNPYSRKCLKCGRREDLFGDALGPDVWEEILPKAQHPERCKKEND